jgi:hypothetical protein
MNHKQGWVLLHRKIWDSKDFNSTLETVIFIYLLTKACHEPTEVVYRRKKIWLNRGEICIALRDLAKKFEITVKRVRTILRNLERAQNLAHRRHKTLSVFFVIKYDKYQVLEKPKAHKKAQDKAHRTNNSNKFKITNTSIGKTNYDNIYTMKKVTIDKSSIGHLKDLNTAIKPKEKVMSEFEYAQKHLDKEDLAEYTRLALQESGKS